MEVVAIDGEREVKVQPYFYLSKESGPFPFWPTVNRCGDDEDGEISTAKIVQQQTSDLYNILEVATFGRHSSEVCDPGAPPMQVITMNMKNYPLEKDKETDTW